MPVGRRNRVNASVIDVFAVWSISVLELITNFPTMSKK